MCVRWRPRDRLPVRCLSVGRPRVSFSVGRHRRSSTRECRPDLVRRMVPRDGRTTYATKTNERRARSTTQRTNERSQARTARPTYVPRTSINGGTDRSTNAPARHRRTDAGTTRHARSDRRTDGRTEPTYVRTYRPTYVSMERMKERTNKRKEESIRPRVRPSVRRPHRMHRPAGSIDR